MLMGQTSPTNPPLSIGVIGAGYVGLTTGVCFSEVGHQVICVDNDDDKLAMLERGQCPIYEPDLELMLRKNLSRGTLTLRRRVNDTVRDCQVIFICVNTPPKTDGRADLRFVEAVAR